jgi:hypothetical protein
MIARHSIDQNAGLRNLNRLHYRENFMPNSDAGIFLIAFAAMLLLWQPVVFLSIIGTYAGAYVFYRVTLFWLPQLFR